MLEKDVLRGGNESGIMGTGGGDGGKVMYDDGGFRALAWLCKVRTGS